MFRKASAYLEKWEMVSPGMRVCVGFSGGADSTALLYFLWKLGQARGFETRALHVNHGIRGEEALRDQKFCENFCQEHAIVFKAVSVDVPEAARQEGISVEEAGRKARRRLLEECVEEGFADRVALAHHQNDQAETMLFHLMRGTGLKGLRGMEPVCLPYLRPFLCVTRAEIERWLIQEGIPWVEDSTNHELQYTRNQIRRRVLEPMEEIRPGAAFRMAGCAAQLLEVEDFLGQELLKAKDGCVRREGGSLHVLLDAFARLHPALQKMLVLSCLEELAGSRRNLEAVHAEQVLALSGGKRGARLSLPGGICAVLGYGELLLKKGYGIKNIVEPVFIEPDGEYTYRGEAFSFQLEDWEKKYEIPVNCYTKWFDYDKIKNILSLRARQPGDFLEVAAGAHKKLKDYLIDCKIRREERDSLILLADGSHIVWVVGRRISEAYKITAQTKRILKVRWLGHGGGKNGETSY